MEPKVIKTDAEHGSALQALEALWNAEPGTPEGDEAELWTLLIEKYEEEHFPIELPDPLTAIRFRMEQAGLKAKDLAPFIGSPSKVSEVLNGKRNLSLSMIRSLHEGLGIPAAALLGKPRQAIPEEIPGMEWERFPVAEMLNRGWFADFRGTLREARQRTEELVRAMVPDMEVSLLQPALLRCHVRSNGRFDRYALAAWQLRIHSLCRDEKLSPYTPGTICEDFIENLVHFSTLDNSPQLAREFLTDYGIHLVTEPHLPRTHLDGAALWHDDHPVVALTLRFDRIDHFWFTLVHELAHLCLHIPAPEPDCFFDDLEEDGDGQETEADRFAAACLIPDSDWQAWFSRRRANRAAVCSFAKKLRIHPGIVAGRIRRTLKNYRLLTPLVSQPVRECLGVGP